MEHKKVILEKLGVYFSIQRMNNTTLNGVKSFCMSFIFQPFCSKLNRNRLSLFSVQTARLLVIAKCAMRCASLSFLYKGLRGRGQGLRAVKVIGAFEKRRGRGVKVMEHRLQRSVKNSISVNGDWPRQRRAVKHDP